jgi:lactate dehydrogenase-like 2-hydroxyacid dehydrogenase
MKVIIAGSRDVTDIGVVEMAIRESGFEITEVVSGCCRGVDKLGEKWANEHNIPVKRFPSDWHRLGNSGGVVRNEEMAEHAEALIAIPFKKGKGGSRGTSDMIQRAINHGLKVHILSYDEYLTRVIEYTEQDHI